MNDISDLMNKALKEGFIIADELTKHYDKDSEEYKKIIKKLKEEDVNIITHEQLEDDDSDKKIGYIDNILTAYIQDIKSYPLLSLEEEIDLATKMWEGKKAKKALQNPDLSPEEKERLNNILNEGEGAKEYFINCNLRLVVWWASKYRNRGLALEDIIQEGNMGLIRAVEKYNPEKKVRFSTYASSWIRKYILRGIQNQARTVRLPIHVSSLVSKLKNAQRELALKLDREPTVEEIAEEMDLSVGKVIEYQSYISDTVSLDTTIGNEEGLTLGDLISNPNINNPFEEVANEEYHRELKRILAELNPREYQVITLRFGLLDGTTHTLEEIGKIIGLTRERVRQIESKALRKLRHPTRSAKIKQFLRM
ncbi:MAG TPA: sigma-70 family RNA polymerase sigma factor [Acholeplasmataceae bacterium]|nr:sigma-70 family RNA polymerase sigma factor [Acholeplasmataceae bacterium]